MKKTLLLLLELAAGIGLMAGTSAAQPLSVRWEGTDRAGFYQSPGTSAGYLPAGFRKARSDR